MPEDPNKNSSEDEENICAAAGYTLSSIVDENNKRVLQFIEDVTCNAAEVQKRVLNEILSRNAGVEYLQRHGLCLYGQTTSHQEFKKMIPVVKYEDLKPDIDRIANGDTSPILCSQPISEFLTSSGTSGGERKLMPTIEEELDRKSFLYSLLMPVMEKFVPNLHKGKGMYFLFIKSEARTPGGLVARPVLTSYYRSSHFKDRPYYDPYNNYTSPIETILCPDSHQSMYSQMLCGLCQRDEVLRVGAVFASGFIRAIRFLQNHWPILCKDIRTGTVDAEITDGSVRNAVMKILKRPNPKLAEFIEEECRKESWKDIITRLWPKTKYIDVIVTGTMSQYIPTLNYYGNDDLPLVCTMYASSECYFGINLNPLSKPSEVTYTLIPTMAYFEFLPVSSSNDEHQELVDLVDVQIGQEYELVITTYAGLYRYRVGDILRVAGFKNNAPEFTFICRKNVALSIDSDKTDEVELHNAVTEAANHLLPFDATLIEYTSCADTSTIPGHYVLYWEISLSTSSSSSSSSSSSRMKRTQQIPVSIFEDCCLTIEESLNSVYRQCRVSDKSIGPLELKIVENGTFDKLMDFAISNGASINQYKAPRCVNYAPILELLNSRVVSTYFSPKCPKWSPGHNLWRTP